ncbi:MAG: prolyl oligopeptidase family serine peptidase [Oceanospirillaceae bacterium]|nr:prolyl oligopeptidase family serine peptidase [Oceanospirillaceae bacterium]MCP5335650.1 prolyl oligopeptidase family serine peptidase [Oceanospirillaceae bacterium]
MKKTLSFFAAAALAASASVPAKADILSELLPNGFSLVAGLLGQGVFPTSANFTTDDSVVFTSRVDGTQIAGNIFVPTNVSGPRPAIIFVSSWGLNEYEYLAEAARFAEEGYIVLSYSARGWGESGGLIDTAGPKDMEDFSSAIDYLIANYNVDASKIGASGISYGSGISLLGAAHDSRIRAVVAMSTWGSLVESLYGQQTPRQVWGSLLVLTGKLLGRMDPIIEDTWNDVSNHRNIPAVTTWADERSPLKFVSQLNTNKPAVYISQNWGDNLFQVNSVFNLFNQLNTPKHIDLQAGTHAMGEIATMLADGNSHVWNNAHRWFAQYLKGESNAMESQLPVGMKVKFSSNGYEQMAALPGSSAKTQTYYLHPRNLIDNGDLSTSPYTSWFPAQNTINSFSDTLASTQIPLLSQMLEIVDTKVQSNIPLISMNTTQAVVFDSGKLSSTMKIRGIPSLSMYIQPWYDTVQMVAYLYDMDSSGTGTLITHAPVTLPAAKSGQLTKVDMKLVGTAYDVPAGHKVVLVVDTEDLLYTQPTWFPYSIDFEFNKNYQSTLTLPIL